MSSKKSLLQLCSLFEATPADVPSAFRDLSGDMNPDFVHVFLDKLERYAKKPDRALFLVQCQDTIIAFATIINKAPVPDELEQQLVAELSKYSCGTGLMVLPEFRNKGVASLLVDAWECWSLQNGLPGIWVVTRQMGEWYQAHFHYSCLTTVVRDKVKKTVLRKEFCNRKTDLGYTTHCGSEEVQY